MRKSNKSILLINSASCLLWVLHCMGYRQKQSIVQKDTNMNCCGGIVWNTIKKQTQNHRNIFDDVLLRKRSIREKLSMIGTDFPCSTTGSGECCPRVRK